MKDSCRSGRGLPLSRKRLHDVKNASINGPLTLKSFNETKSHPDYILHSAGTSCNYFGLMKIGISAQILKEKPTGVELYVLNLLKHLLAADRQNIYYIYCYENELTRQFKGIDNAVLRWIRMPQNRISRVLFEQTLLPLQLKLDKVDVYHSPAYILPLLLPGSIPSVTTVFDSFALSHPGFCKLHNRIYYGQMLPFALHRSNRVITLSGTMKYAIASAGAIDPARIVVSYPGITTSAAGAPEVDGRYILHVGNFDPKKNAALLIKAFEKMKGLSQLPHKLVFAGEQAWQYPAIRELASQSKSAGDIIFTGYVSEERKWGLYRNADLFVFPSLFEGLGFPPLEAATAGTRILVSDIPVFRETVPGAAFFESGNEDDCAEQMARLLAGKQPQNIDLSRFSFETHARRCIEIYNEILTPTQGRC